MGNVGSRIMRRVYSNDVVVVVPEPDEDRSAEIAQAFASLEQVFDRAHFDRSHPARATLRSLESHVRDLQASLATTEGELARRMGEVEEMRDSVRQMRDRVEAALVAFRIATARLGHSPSGRTP